MSNWYCIRTRRYKESWVAQQLSELGYDTHLPLLRERRIVRRQLKWVIEPLFPCYLFGRFAASDGFCAVSYTRGVVSVVGTLEDGPIAVDEWIITALRERSVNGCIEVRPAPLTPGDELEVVEGPFRGLKALFQQELKAGERVAVLLELLASQVRVELPRAYVRKQSGTYDWKPAA